MSNLEGHHSHKKDKKKKDKGKRSEGASRYEGYEFTHALEQAMLHDGSVAAVDEFFDKMKVTNFFFAV
jgi:hypothetical protein